jgi:hypothetical protein
MHPVNEIKRGSVDNNIKISTSSTKLKQRR